MSFFGKAVLAVPLPDWIAQSIVFDSRFSCPVLSTLQTVERLKSILQSKGMKLFALIDHSKEAELVGLTIAAYKTANFRYPKGGTPLMLATPSSAITSSEDAGPRGR
jgi:hypothetical protein